MSIQYSGGIRMLYGDQSKMREWPAERIEQFFSGLAQVVRAAFDNLDVASSVERIAATAPLIPSIDPELMEAAIKRWEITGSGL